VGFSWDPFSEQWEKGFAALQRFRKHKGHCRVVRGHKVDGLNLGDWVIRQRFQKDKLPSEQIRRLNSLGFNWDLNAEQWEQNFAALQEFRKREGHCRVVVKHQEGGLNLGGWVSAQRLKKDSLTPDRLKRLKSLGFIWNPHTEQWEKYFAALQKFRKREGHCRVVSWHKEDGLKLGNWVQVQRVIKSRLTPDRVKRLKSLGFSWDPIAEKWEQNFAALQKFRKREGHSRVPDSHQEDRLNLGAWVGLQRATKDRLAPDRLKRLKSFGFIWDPITEQWEQAFAALEKFHKREGHCRVPESHQVEGLKLGLWVQNQRARKDRLKPNQLNRLNSLGFVWRK